MVMTLWSKRSMTRIKVQNPYSRMSPVRFHPGHYWNPRVGDQGNWNLDVNGNITSTAWINLLAKIAPYSAIRGLTMRANWTDIQPTSINDYSGIDFLEALCDDLAAIGKRLIVHVPTRTFPDTQRAAPVWARTEPGYDGGDHPYSSSAVTPAVDGYNINWHNAAVTAKMVQVFTQLATRLAAKPNFEGIILMETAYGTRVSLGPPVTFNSLSGAEKTAYLNGQIAAISQVKISRPDLLALQYANTRTDMPTHIPQLVAAGVGIGGPDLWVQPEGSTSPVWAENSNVWANTGDPGTYRYYHTYHNQIPLLIHVQPDNYRWPTKDGFGNYVPSIQELIDSAKTATTPNLQVNYVVWTDDPGGDANLTTGTGNYPNFDNQVLTKLAEAAQTADPAGGLNAVYPSDYLL